MQSHSLIAANIATQKGMPEHSDPN
jgi:hypothetical protein